MKIKEIIQETKGTLIQGDGEAEVKEFCKDTRIIKEGDTYIGIKGENFDGNTLWQKAFEAGADTVIVQGIDFSKDNLEQYKNKNTEIGIDVSHWQGNINFKEVKKAGVEFVYIRVGRGDGIGKDYVLDDKFIKNIKGFNKVGIPVGIYFYSYANSKKDAIKEAKALPI